MADDRSESATVTAVDELRRERDRLRRDRAALERERSRLRNDLAAERSRRDVLEAETASLVERIERLEAERERLVRSNAPLWRRLGRRIGARLERIRVGVVRRERG